MTMGKEREGDAKRGIDEDAKEEEDRDDEK